MTFKEAGIIIGNIPIPLVILGTHDKCYSLTEYQNAKAMAIKSLEAWESLREELKYELCKKVHEKDSCIPCPNQTTSCSYTGLRIYELNNIINHVIDKHLAEVSE